jgi:hypothetical protein
MHPNQHVPDAWGQDSPFLLDEVLRATSLVYPQSASLVAGFSLLGRPPTVRLLFPGGGSCSGALINAANLITSAHCFPASGDYRVIVDYGTAQLDASGNRICINPGRCNPPAGNNMWVTRYPFYGGTSDVRRDFALVFNYTGGWKRRRTPPAVGSPSWITGAFIFISTGRPSGSAVTATIGVRVVVTGVGRLSDNIDLVETDLGGYWIGRVVTGRGRPCKGDSGSPAQNWDNGFAISIGVFSTYDHYDGEVCGAPNHKYRYNKIGDFISWLNMVGDGMCSRTYSGRLPYTKCWE